MTGRCNITDCPWNGCDHCPVHNYLRMMNRSLEMVAVYLAVLAVMVAGIIVSGELNNDAAFTLILIQN